MWTPCHVPETVALGYTDEGDTGFILKGLAVGGGTTSNITKCLDLAK